MSGEVTQDAGARSEGGARSAGGARGSSGAGARGASVHVLCGAANPASRARFEEEAAALGVGLRWLDPHEVSAGEGGALRLAGEQLEVPAVALARSGGFTTDRALAALKAYEAAGVRVVDSAAAVELCRDKLLAAEALASAGLPVPRTWAAGEREDAAARERAGAREGAGEGAGLPVVVKPARGMKGEDVVLAEDAAALDAALEALAAVGRVAVVQEYVPHEYDVRVIVVGDEALGAMRRVPQLDFRCNLHAGGRAQATELTRDLRELACAAAAAVGAEVAGVDLLPRESSYVVLEVNTSPGFDGFESATRVNVARAILERALGGALGGAFAGA